MVSINLRYIDLSIYILIKCEHCNTMSQYCTDGFEIGYIGTLRYEIKIKCAYCKNKIYYTILSKESILGYVF